LQDPSLTGIGCVVFDEFHERHVDSDLALALCERKAELHLVVMSATLDAEPVARHLQAPRLRAEGRSFPVTVEYANEDRPLPQRVARALRASEGDALVFLPGVGEIERCADALKDWDVELLKLHGQLRPEEQFRVFVPSPRRRVILSTNVAETSVTVDGVTLVVDSGLARIPDWDPATGLQRLSLSPVSRASAEQRAGRAGRTAPGTCIRLYSKTDFTHRREHTPPEIHRADSAGLLLTVLSLGESIESLRWLDPPSPASVATGTALLRRLGALDDQGLTAFGHKLRKLPVHPRLGALMLHAAAAGHRRAGALGAAILSDRDFVPRGEAVTVADSDLQWRIGLLDGRPDRRHHRPTAERIKATARQLERAVDGTAGDAIAFDRAVFRAFSDRLAKRVSESEVLFAAGGRGLVDPGSVVRDTEWLVALNSETRGHRGRERTYVLLASAVEREWIEADLADEIATVEETEIVDGRVFAIEGFRIGSVWLDQERNPARPGPVASEALRATLGRRDLQTVFDESEVDNAMGRLAAAGIDADESAILAAACEGETTVDGVRKKSLAQILYAIAPGIDRAAPRTLELPSGRPLPIRYARGRPPWIESYLQDFFGMAESPKVSGSPLTVHLWAPNRRPIQVTNDLASFWANAYPELKPSLSRRYPKHVWPDDPGSAPPKRLKRHR
ncbi:MAG: ATP-dependent helicase C-terminal domain-containing protein, partial [Myxococcota bacterium]